MSFIIEVTATNTVDRKANPELPVKAVKISAIHPEPPGPQEQAEWRAKAVSTYRREYDEWSKGDPQVTWRELGG